MKAWSVSLAIVAIFLGAFFVVNDISAQQNSSVRRLQISPLHTYVNITPGSTYTGSVVLKNSGTELLSVSLSAETFKVKNEQYDYIFLPDSPINNWVHFFTPELTLKPDQSYEARFLISAPIEAEPGGVYLGIFAASLPSKDRSIKSTNRVGSLFYINIAGDTTKKGELLKFSAPWLHTSGTIPWSVTIRNAGITHFNAKYIISLENLWGGEINTITGSPLIFPRSVRLVSSTINEPQWLGVYRITYSIDLGDNETAQNTQLFIYAPLGQIIPLVAIMLALISILSSIVRRHTSSKKR